MSENYLVTPIDVLPAIPQSAQGIHQSDVILRTAIQAGLDDIRQNPSLLDYVFSSLPRDPLTHKEYGVQQVDSAKEWFLSQDIPVFMNTRVDENKIPCITIASQSSSEGAATLGDVNYEVTEDVYGTDKIVYYDLNLKSYAPTSGICSLPSDAEIELFAGEKILTKAGNTYEILDVLDPWTFQIASGISESIAQVKVISAQKAVVTLESLEFRETLEIGCHAHSEPIYLTYLWSILIFVLLRYKEELIEGRGLERTTISSSGVVLNTSFPIQQPVFTRMTTVTGFVRQYWPKFVRNPIEGMTMGPGPGQTEPPAIRVIDSNGIAQPIFSDDLG